MNNEDTLFNQWIKYIFDHPVTKPEWYWGDNQNWDHDEPPAFVISSVTRAFENAEKVLGSFTNAQLNQGFWFLLSPAIYGYFFALLDTTIPWPDRKRCI